MYVVFFSTSNVFKAEEKFISSGIECEVVPTPASDRAYCGVCIEVDNNADLSIISDLEYAIMEG